MHLCGVTPKHNVNSKIQSLPHKNKITQTHIIPKKSGGKATDSEKKNIVTSKQTQTTHIFLLKKGGKATDSEEKIIVTSKHPSLGGVLEGATHFSALQRTATHCNTRTNALQRTATRCNTL